RTLDINQLVRQNKPAYDSYKKERESCLYVEPKPDGTWSYPRSTVHNITTRKTEINEKLDGLYGFLLLLGDNEFRGNIPNLQLFTRRPIGQPIQRSISFSSTVGIIPRIRRFSQELSQRLASV
ncbi:MAG: hypothetical protein KGI25_04115, partial [Thaumarchaeota archaeon]|nr:hypothetical protein [Nitrososphaerota archaeon]